MQARLAPTDERLAQRFGNYYLVKLLGRGGFAQVYLAEHLYLKRYAAIKLLRQALAGSEQDNFLLEAQRLADLVHPHIVRILDYSVEAEVPFLVMEFAQSGTLAARHPKGSPVPLPSVVSYVKQIASALQYIHDHGLIHRDVKPENVLIGPQERLLLSDFGIAALASRFESASEQITAGTPAYLAPEQTRGYASPASDQYALAIVVYEWLCGRRPLQGSDMQVLAQHVRTPPLSPRSFNPTLPQQVEAVLLQALAKQPQERFPTIQAFAAALEQAVPEHVSASARPFKLLLPAKPGQASEPFASAVPTVALSSPQTASHNGSRTHLSAVLTAALPSPHPAADDRNRQRLLQKVWTHWISGVLEQSLHGAALLALGLQEQAQALEDPWQLVMQPTTSADGQSQALPAGTRISQVYDQAGGELLLLGDPGAGKTTLLLELARELLERAKNDATHPIPVVFNLSSWALKRQPLVSWLVEELNTKYQVPRKLASQWVREDRLLLLLDGLDEVQESQRASCVQAINAYRHKHGLVPIVVCSRNQDYLRLSKRLLLQAAVLIEPLTSQQVEQYLLSLGQPLEGLRLALRQDPGLLELASTPLMLSILALTYSGKSVTDLLAPASQTRHQQVLSAYIQRMLERGHKHLRASPARMMAWLSWLASQMQRHNQSELYLEQLQPDWLPHKWLRVFYGIIVAGLPYALLTGSVLLATGLANEWVNLFFNARDHRSDILTTIASNGQNILGTIQSLTLLALIIASGVWVLNGLLYKLDEDSGPKRSWWRQNPWRLGIRALCNGACAVPVSYVVLHSNLTSSFLIGAPFAFAIGLTDAFFGAQGITITPVETLSWSWKKMLWNGATFALLATCTISTIINFFFAFSNGYYSWHIFYEMSRNGLGESVFPALFEPGYFAFWLLIALIGGSLIGLFGGLLGGLSGEQMARQKRVNANEGIKRSRRNGFLLGTISGIASSLLAAGFFIRYISPSNFYFTIPGALLGTFVGILVGLRNGGYSWIKHSVLRLLLWVSRRVPLRTARFLDQAAQCILLRKVGGGYVFVHRLLLEHFASLSSPRHQQQDAANGHRIVEGSISSSPLTTQPIASSSQRFAALPAKPRPSSLLRGTLTRRSFVVGAASLGVLGSGALWWLAAPHPRRVYLADPTVLGISWSPEGKYLVSAQTDEKALCVWDALAGQRVTVLADTFIEEENLFYEMLSPVSWQPHGPHVAYIAGKQKSINIWNTTTGKRTATCKIPTFKDSQKIGLTQVVWAPAGQRIAAVGGGYIFLWDATTGQALLHQQYEDGAAKSVAWSPDGQWIAIAGVHVMQVLHATTLQPLFKRSWTDTASFSDPQNYQESYGTVAWSPDSQYVATAGGQNDTVWIWQRATGRLVQTYRKQSNTATRLAWSPKGDAIASTSGSQIHVWQVATGELMAIYSGHLLSKFESLAWSPNGAYIASADGSYIHIWDAP